MTRNKKRAAMLILLPFVLLPAGYFFTGFYRNYISPNIMPCPVRFFFGIYCPGCGGTHCVYELASGHIGGALRYNALFPAAFVLLALCWAEEVLRAFGIGVRLVPSSRKFYIAAAVAVLIYTVLRNVVPGLAPI